MDFPRYIYRFRFEVGADWFNYVRAVEKDGDETFKDLLFRAYAPGYALLLKICSNLNWNVYGFNIISAGIFSGGLVYFCNKLKILLRIACILSLFNRSSSDGGRKSSKCYWNFISWINFLSKK